MKKSFFLFLALTTFLMSCENSVLDKPFNPILYKTEFTQFFKDKNITNEDAFLINYTIIRQRDYLGYEVEGKTYGEILTMAKGFQQTGIPINETYDEVENQEVLTTRISKIKSTFLDKENDSSRKIKNAKFTCTFTNNSDKDVGLNYATFILNGPFKEHIITAGFETNCKVLAKDSMIVNYVVNAKEMKNNLFYGKKSTIKRLMIDDIIATLDIQVGGITYDKRAQDYEECFIEDQVVEPFQLSSYKEMYPDKNFNAKMVDGVQTVHRGPRLFVREGDDKIINYK